MLRSGLVYLLSAIMMIAPVDGKAGDSFKFSGFFKQKRPEESAVVQLARTLDELEKKLNREGTVVTKAPDIWGEARLTKHRQEFEREMAKELQKFDFKLNAAIARSDQAFLSSALAMSLLGGDIESVDQSPTLNISQAASLLPNSLAQQSDGTSQVVTPPTNSVIAQTTPGGLVGSNFKLTDSKISIEPEILLDQKARYLNHLHEIRRLNEGDDTSDSPGYSLNLVRVPVSIMPGTVTQKNHGAEVTITATPHVTEELLPTTFRDLVVNDLVDLLSPVVRKLAEELPDLNTPLEKQGDVYKELATFLTGAGDYPTGPLVLDFYGENGTATSDERLTAKLVEMAQKSDWLKELKLSIADEGKLRNAISSFDPFVPNTSHEIVPILEPLLQATISQLGQAIYGMTGQILHTGVGSVTRRSREPVSSSEIPFVFGVHELVSLAYDFRQRNSTGSVIHLSDVRSYLHEELESAYDLVSSPAADNPAGQMLANPAFVLPGYGSSRWDTYPNSSGASLPELVRNVTYQNTRDLLHHRTAVTNRFSRILRVLVNEGKTELELHVPSVVTSLAWAVVVESALLNQRLNEDIKHVSQDPGCGCSCPGELIFCGPNPDQQAREVFADYVKCRWPIHVFALDPQAQDQNVADSFSMRREMQLALALAFAGGRINAESMTRYVRRLEIDMETIALNRTVAAFGHGKDVFGWRFYPRVQSPPFESTSTTVFRDLLRGGPSKDDLRRSWEIEPGMRECTAIVLMPSFITHATFDIRGNYFPLGRHKFHEPSDTVTSIEDNMEMSHKIRLMENATCSIIAEANCYRNGEVERLLRRKDQLAGKLPLQTVHARVPNENTLGGFEMFSSGITDLGPELLDFYGMPGIDTQKDTVLFLVGNNFSVHDTKVLAGNKDVEYDLVSRQVMRVTIPAGVQTVDPFTCSNVEKRCHQASRVVDVHVATPYGVSQHLEIPVIEDEGSCETSGYRWARENLIATYKMPINKGTDAASTEDDTLDKSKANVFMSPPFLIDIQVPPGNFSHPKTAKLSLVMTSPELGLSTRVKVANATSADSLTAEFNSDTKTYQIRDANFVTLQNEILDVVIDWINAIKKKDGTNSANYEIKLEALITPGALEPSIRLDNTLTLNVSVEVE